MVNDKWLIVNGKLIQLLGIRGDIQFKQFTI